MSVRKGKVAMAKSDEIRAKTATFDPSQAVGAIEPLWLAGNKWLENWMAVGSELLEFSRARPTAPADQIGMAPVYPAIREKQTAFDRTHCVT